MQSLKPEGSRLVLKGAERLHSDMKASLFPLCLRKAPVARASHQGLLVLLGLEGSSQESSRKNTWLGVCGLMATNTHLLRYVPRVDTLVLVCLTKSLAALSLHPQLWGSNSGWYMSLVLPRPGAEGLPSTGTCSCPRRATE